MLIFIISIRFFIKIITTFSYFVIKITVYISISILQLSFFKYENINAFIHNLLYDFCLNFFEVERKLTSNFNINTYYYNFIGFNFKWIDKVFKDIESVKKAIASADKMFIFTMIKTEKKCKTPFWCYF